MPTGSPLLDDYDRTGIVTPGLQRALDATKAKLGQPFQLQRPTQPGPTLAPPGPNVPSLARPQETAGITEAPTAPAFSPTPSPISLATPQRVPLTQSPLMQHLQARHEELTDPTLPTSKPGVDRIHNPWLRTPLKALEVIGTGFAPRLTSAIPGTTLHHRGLVQTNEAEQNQLEKQETEHANREHLEAETGNLGATTAKTQAETPEIAPNAAANREHLGAETTNLGAQTEHTNAETDALKTAGAFQHVLDPETGDLVALTKDPKTGKVSAEVVYKGNPKVETDMTEANGRRVLVNKKTGEVLKDLGAAKTASSNDHGQNFVDPATGQLVRVEPGQKIPQGGMSSTQYGSLFVPSGQTKSRAEQGTAVIKAGQNIMKMMDDPKYSKVFGNLGSYVNQFINDTPISDPAASRMISELASYAALQPALHGFRSHDALKEFMKIIGGTPKNPEALKEAIRGIEDTARVVEETGGKQSGGGESKVRKYNPATGRLE